MKLENIITRRFEESMKVKEKTLNLLKEKIEESSKLILKTLKSGNKVLICGNGGSAADAQHLAAELQVRYKKEREGLPAIALTTDTSIITATSNDYSFEDIFSRQVNALGKADDLLIAITTSGKSRNIIKALKVAKEKKMKSICLNGKKGGYVEADINMIIPSEDTPSIQETHITIIHTWCEVVDELWNES